MESIFREKIIQVVTGNAPRNLWEALADEITEGGRYRPQLAVNVALPPVQAGAGLNLRIRHRGHFHPRTVISEDVQRLDVVVGFAGHHRMHSAGVVADHAADSA